MLEISLMQIVIEGKLKRLHANFLEISVVMYLTPKSFAKTLRRFNLNVSICSNAAEKLHRKTLRFLANLFQDLSFSQNVAIIHCRKTQNYE